MGTTSANPLGGLDVRFRIMGGVVGSKLTSIVDMPCPFWIPSRFSHSRYWEKGVGVGKEAKEKINA